MGSALWSDVHLTLAQLCTRITRVNFQLTYSACAMLSAQYTSRFILTDIECEGRKNDGGVLAQSGFGQALRDETMELPNENTSRVDTLPYCLFVHEGFPFRNSDEAVSRTRPFRRKTHFQLHVQAFKSTLHHRACIWLSFDNMAYQRWPSHRRAP